MTAKVDFKYINPDLYRHPGEVEAKSKLEKFPGFQKAMAMAGDNSTLKAERQAETASMAKVGPGVYPALADLWHQTRAMFTLPDVPLHIAWDAPQPYALRGGNDNPAVILSSRLLSELPEIEMEALLAQQAGLIRLGNAQLMAATDFARWFLDAYGIFGAPAAIPAWGIENWRRYALFSADRAAALSRGDPEGVAQLLAREAGAGEKAWGGVVKPDDLRVQGLEALSQRNDWSNNKMNRFLFAMNRKNSVALIRRMDLLDWFAGGTPAKILAGEVTHPEGAKMHFVGDRDPSAAYWGEFASQDPAGDGGKGHPSDGPACPMAELMGVAEKGVNSFMKAGEAFWNTLMDNSRKN